MKIVDRPWSKAFKPFLFLFGIPFFLFGFYFYSREGNIAAMDIGTIFILIGLVIKMIDLSIKGKLEMLESEGICYDARVVSIKPSYWIKIGSYITARVECRFQSEEGERTVVSKHFLLTPWDKKDKLFPKIYCHASNLDQYLVKLYRSDNGVG